MTTPPAHGAQGCLNCSDEEPDDHHRTRCGARCCACPSPSLSTAYRLGARIGFRAEQEASHRLRTAVSGHVLDPRSARTGPLPGDLLSVTTSDAEMVGVVIRQLALTAAAVVGFVLTGVVLAAIDPVRSVLAIVFTAAGLASLDGRLGLAGLGALPFYVLGLRWYLPRSGPSYRREREANGARDEAFLTGVHASRTLRALRPRRGPPGAGRRRVVVVGADLDQRTYATRWEAWVR